MDLDLANDAEVLLRGEDDAKHKVAVPAVIVGGGGGGMEVRVGQSGWGRAGQARP